ncbi:hypothetical protein [Companilactobacillus sp. HBUAS56257]|uniref:hypothetical protein n=1 Tax=Companilactobacillus sp. HBUAS56257 TaxID=3109360 RepID=UPI002FEF8F52
MKKNVKYIGSAVAVALLAAGAPVVIPMIEPVQIVQADSVTNDPNYDVKTALTRFKSQFGDIYVAGYNSIKLILNTLSGYSADKFYYFNPGHPQSIHDIQSDQDLKKIKLNPIEGQNGDFNDDIFENTNSQVLFNDELLGYITFSDAVSGDIDSSTGDKLKDYANNLNNNEFPIRATVHVTAKSDSLLRDIDPSLTTFSFNIYLSRFDIKKDNSDIIVSSGTTLTDSILNEVGTNSLSVTDNYSQNGGDTTSMSAPHFGKSVFSSEKDAQNYAESDDFDPESTLATGGSKLDNGKIETPGTYWQTVSYKLSGNKDQAIQYMLSGEKDPKTNGVIDNYETFINGTKPTKSNNFILNKNSGYITVVRSFKVIGNLNANINPVQASVNSKTSDLPSTGLGKLINGSNDVSSTSSTDGVLYTDKETQHQATTNEIKDGTFKKARTYYRRVVFTLDSGNASDYNISSDAYAHSGNTITFVQEIDVKDSATPNINSVNPKVGDSINSNTGENTDNTANNNTLMNIDGSLVDTTKGQYSGVSFGTSYYKYDPDLYNSDSAYSNALNKEVINNEGTTTDVVDTNGNFIKSGDYLRTITFYLIDGAVDTNTFGTDTSSYKVGKDGEGNNTVTYIQKVHIAPVPTVTATVSYDAPTIYKNSGSDKIIAALNNTTNDTLKIGSGNEETSIIDIDDQGEKRIEFGKTYYSDINLSTPVMGLSALGTYYRTITYYLTENVDTLDFTGANKLSTDSKDNSVTFVQPFTVKNFGNVTVNVPDATVAVGSTIINSPEPSLTADIKPNMYSSYWPIDELYKNIDDAKNNSNSFELSESTPVGVYYRQIRIKFNGKINADDYKFPEVNGVAAMISSDGTSVGYYQKVIVANPITATVPDITIGENVPTTTIDDDFSGINFVDSNTKEPLKVDVGLVAPMLDPQMPTLYFKTAAGAMAFFSGDTSGLANIDQQEISSFSEKGTYYRIIGFTLSNNEISNYEFDSTINGEKAYILPMDDKTYVFYIQKINVTDGFVENIDTVSAHVGDSVGSINKGESTIEANGSSIINDDLTTVGDKYYSNKEEVLSDDGSSSNSEFTAPGTYYRTITFTLKTGSTSDYTFDGVQGTDYRIDSDKTVTMVQPVQVRYAVVPVIGSPNVSRESLVSDSKLNKPTLTAYDNSVVSDISYGDNYYDISNTNNTVSNILNGNAETDDVVDKDTQSFIKSGSFYRTVTFTLNGDIDDFDFSKLSKDSYKVDGNKVTLLQKVNILSGKAVAKVDNLIVNVGSSTDITDTNGDDLVDSDSDKSLLVDNSDKDRITFGTTYYTNAKSALNDDGKTDVVDVGSTFMTPGQTYYRTVTFKLNDAAKNYAFDDFVNGVGSVRNADYITYVQSVTTTANSTTAIIPDLDVAYGTSFDSIIGNTDGIELNDNKTNDTLIVKDGISADSKIYATANDAYEGKVSSDTGEFTKDKYYRRITINLGDAASNYDFKDVINGFTPIKDGTKLTFVQQINVKSVVKVATVSGKVGEKVEDIGSDTANLTINDEGPMKDHVTTGNKLFTTAKNAIENDSTGSEDNLTAGIRYRRITYTLDEPADQYIFNGKPGEDYVIDGNKVTFAQQIIIEPVEPITVTASVGPLDIDDKTKVNNHKVKDNQNYTLTGAEFDKIGTTYYKTLKGALNGVNGDDSDETDYSSNGYFKAGNYYRLVYFKIDSNFSKNYTVQEDNVKVFPDKGFAVYVQPMNVHSAKKEVKAYISSGETKVGQSNIKSGQVELRDSTGNIIKPVAVSYGHGYYVNNKDVFDDNVKPDVANGESFKKAKLYYRAVTFELTNADFANYNFDNADYVNAEENEVSFIQPIYVEAEDTQGVIVHVDPLYITSGTSESDVAKVNGTLEATEDGDIGDISEVGTTYYNSINAALNQSTNADDLATDAVSSGTFNQGHYYRLITFESSKDLSKGYLLNEDNAKLISNNKVIYAQEINVSDNPVVKANITAASAKVGDSTDLKDTAGNELFTQSGIPISAKITFGSDYYSNSGDVFDDNVKPTFTGGNFTKADTYYREITFHLDTDDAINSNEFGTNAKIDKDSKTVSYVQAVVVSANETATFKVDPLNIKAGTPVRDSAVGASSGTLTDGTKVLATGTPDNSRFYRNVDDAKNNASILADAIVSGNFKKGTYYRVISFKPTDPNFKSDYVLHDSNYWTDAKGNLCYAQLINVGATGSVDADIKLVTANVGDSVDGLDKTGNNLTDDSGKQITANISFGDIFDDDDSVFAVGAKPTSDIVNGKFTKAKTYYRAVIFNVDPQVLADNNFSGDARIDTDKHTISYIQAISVRSDRADVTVNDLTINAGTSTKDVKLTQTSGYVLKAASGVIDSKVAVGDSYYDSAESALAQGSDLSKAVVNGKFTKSGDYYRLITFTPSVALDADSFADGNAHVNNDGTVTYVQKVHVDKNEASVNASVNDLDVRVDLAGENPALINTKNYMLKDVYGQSLVDKTRGTYGVSLGSKYFLNSDLTGETNDASGAKINKANTYYRTVKFYLTSGAYDANDFAQIGGTYNESDNSVTFVQKIIASNYSAITHVNGVTIDQNVLANDAVLHNASDISVVDRDNGSIIANNGVKFGTDFYTDKAATNKTTNIDSDGRFTKAGTYYQRVTVKLVDNGTNAYTFSGENVSVDPDNNTVTFIRAVTVKEASSTGGSTGGNTGGSTGTGGNSGNSGSTSGTGSSTGTGDTWAYTDNSGVVTTKTDRQMYGLNNQNNDRITNRNLAENTSWKYDQIRTNESGVKQYRVATGEWIDANDVYLGYPQTNQDDDWIYTDVSGIVTTKTNQRQYQLNDQANDVISSRNLKKDTSWKTDQYRTNKAGVQQYRVATGEWVDANDVIFGQNQVAVDDAWTYANIDGIITTKTDQTTYDLDNQDNELIKGRQLVQDTSWKTDQVRTNRAGIKQYRVATGEWVDSNAVFFEEPVETGVFKNAVGVKGIINLDRTSTVYRLYSKEDELIDDYSLAQETSWRTDYRVEDSNGDTYYHVGNDEWIKLVKGVHFNTYAWY